MGPRENCYVSCGSLLPCERLSFQTRASPAAMSSVQPNNPHPDDGCVDSTRQVYLMPTTDTPHASKNIPLALQSLFYKLQYNDASVSTKDLTRSFGWDANESFMQVSVRLSNTPLSRFSAEFRNGGGKNSWKIMGRKWLWWELGACSTTCRS